MKSGIIQSKELKEILEHPEDYIESADFLSWERYFTWLLEKETSKIPGIRKYNKNGKLPEKFTNDKCLQKILDQMHGIIIE